MGSGLNARDLSKARVKARERVLTTESAVNALESQIADAEARLARPSDTVAGMVALAAEHTRLQDDLLTALSAWEAAVAEQKSWGASYGTRNYFGAAAIVRQRLRAVWPDDAA